MTTGNQNDKLKIMSTPLRTIKEICEGNYKFFIPDYQRGYRWGQSHVEALLNDIWEFKSDIYYLQPLMLKKNDDKNNDKYNVIDGQQRLTTIYLILKCLEIETNFTLEYQTRQEITKTLNNPEDDEEYPNPDLYCIKQAYSTIKEWFDPHDKETFKDKLLNRTKFIWYENNTKEDKNNTKQEQESFDHLNGGKIPLSSAELMKGVLFLNLPEDDKKLLGTEWDNIEHFLSKPDIWGFISTDIDKKLSRIELLFEIYLYNKDNKIYKKHSLYRNYSPWIYDGIMECKKETYTELWNDIKSYARQIEHWYNNRKCYHYIGFLMYQGYDIKEIFKNFANLNKQKQEEELKNKIYEKFKNKDVYKNEFIKLSYEQNDDKKKLKLLLLLFNVLTCLNDKSGAYFPFHLYTEIDKKPGWSLEHIFAQHSENLKPEDRIKYVQCLLDQNKDDKNKLEDDENELKEFSKELEKNHKLSEENIKKLAEIEERQEQTLAGNSIPEDKHHICNLALLDKSSNSSLSNSIFDKKVDKIKEFCKEKFIPPATKNVFLKFYSKEVTNFYKWDTEDRKEYQEAIETTLKDYLPSAKEGAKNGK